MSEDNKIHSSKQTTAFISDIRPITVTETDLDSQLPDLAADVFTLLSDPTRIRIVMALSTGEQPVGRLAELVGKNPTTVSQHLAKLRWGKIVQARQEGVRVFYSLINEHAQRLVMHAVYQAEHVVDPTPRHHQNPDGTFKPDEPLQPEH